MDFRRAFPGEPLYPREPASPGGEPQHEQGESAKSRRAVAGACGIPSCGRRVPGMQVRDDLRAWSLAATEGAGIQSQGIIFTLVPFPIPQAPSNLGQTALGFSSSILPTPTPTHTVSSELPKILQANTWSSPMSNACS